ncbi:MAG: T9SS type A sorting domain-containing protein [Bacteroidetes bacterium]|nr:T9SS type A sorting domain-containing protein [Bacteroidota bacterium]
MYSQSCTTKDARGSKCINETTINCDLLPDMTISRQILTDTGGYIEYPQKNADFSMNDGRLRLSVSTPNIGSGPLELRTTNFLVCGSDTFSTGYIGKCPDGLEPKHIVIQRIYQKTSDSVSYFDHVLGAMPYNVLSSSFYIGNFEFLSLRLKNPKEPNPKKWPIVAGAYKNSFCLDDERKCSSYPGICRDSKDNILLDDKFPNSGREGYYDCALGFQGISPGYTDTYDKNLYGMWIDIPPGTCNGNDYYLVLEIDPDNHFLESDKSNNIITVPVNLSRQDNVGNPTAIIYPQGPTTICQGDSLKLLATAAYSYKWSTGDTTSFITVKSGGIYYVTLTSPCGTATSAPLTVNMLDPPAPPITIGDTICSGDSVLLKAFGTESLVWYDKPIGGRVVAKGNSYMTPSLTNSTTFFVENVKTIPGLSGHVGKSDTSGEGKYYKRSSYLIFDCMSPFTLEAITVYAKNPGTFTLSMLEWSGNELNTKRVSLVTGKNRIPLGFPVIPEFNYMLFIKADSGHAFYGNTANLSYPYTIPGVLSIKTSGLGKSDYTCLYDWEITTADFHPASARVSGTAFVDKTCLLRAKRFDKSMPDYTLTRNLFTDVLNIKIEEGTVINYRLVIYDITGRIVKTATNISSGTTVIGKMGLTNGLYFYKIFSERTTLAAGKITVE